MQTIELLGYSISIVTIAILGLFLLSWLLQMFYYLFFYSRLVFAIKKSRKQMSVKTERPSKGTSTPVSILICARNEAGNLTKFLPLILEQDYPDFQVVVVNDCSEDNTEEVLARLKMRYENLYVTSIHKDSKFSHGKKLALTIGIKAAANDWLLLTDADCRPAGKHWLLRMQTHFQEKTEFVLAYGAYMRRPGLLNQLIRYDTAMIALQYFSFALAGKPYMGVGRNLAHRKSLFFERKGFASHLHIASGDDDLLVNAHANKKNTAIELHPESFTFSIPKTSFKYWWRQKQRHLTTGRYYRSNHKFLLSLEILSRLLFYSLFILSLCLSPFWIYILIIFGIRFFTQFFVFFHSMRHFKALDALVLAFMLDILWPMINATAWLPTRFSRKKRRWK